jgi:uncharacterized protein (DUF302 family)
MAYGYSKEVPYDFPQALEKTNLALKEQGFGVITSIDVKKIMKEKLNQNLEDYIILGACNPEFAHKALITEKEIGLLLPCNVIIYVSNGSTVVSALNPMEAMSMVENPELKEIALEVSDKLQKVIDSI